MTLSKLEIQQMLREMNVKFDADETYEELKARLQQENHSLWLKSMSSGRHAPDGAGKILVRKRKKASPEPPDADMPPARQKSDARGTQLPSSQRSRGASDPFRPRPIEKPEPGKPWKAAADGVTPFNRKKNVFESVLRRAGGKCERCGQAAGPGTTAGELIAYHIDPLDRGGEHSIKNVVAVCPTCREMLENDPSARDVKDLKRKTRSRLYDSLQVIRKKTIRTRRPASGHRK